jgi:hypothetical protein
MEQYLKLPDPKVCHTRQLYETGYYLCLVEAPVNCPELCIVREYHLCNHYFRAKFNGDNDNK